MAALYANENFPFQVIEELRRLGHAVLTTLETGRAGRAIPDEEVLSFAIEQKRALLTLNRRDFIRLNRLSSDHAGQAERIHQAVLANEPLKGKLIRVNRPR